MKVLRSGLRPQFIAFAVAGVCVILLATFLLVRRASAQSPSLVGFTISEIRFDESMGEKKSTPKLPGTWRFIGVSNGEKRNSNNLWFQDRDGSIYLVQGFTTEREFIVQESIQRLNASQ